MSATRNHDIGTAVLFSVLLFSPVIAQEKSADQAPADPVKASSRLLEEYRLQDTDEPALPLKPVVPRSAAIETRNEAVAWYMTGRLFGSSARNELKKALNAFRKAVALDPQAIEIYRSLIPLEFAFENIEAAVRYAAKAIQLDPNDYAILQQLAHQEAVAGDLPDAIKHLEQALKSSRIAKESAEFVLLNTSLGVLYALTGQREQAADCYQVIFDAVKTPQKYDMDSRGKSAILNDPPTSYESIGQVFLDANRLKLALEAFELASKTTKQGAGNLSYNRAKILFLSEKYDEALEELQKYFDKQRTSKGRLPYQLLADIFAKLNRSDELIGRLEAMAESDSRNVSLQFFLADRLADLNELERARAIYDNMLRNGGDSSGYAGLARVLRKMQKADELLEALGRGFARGEEAISSLEPEVKAIAEDKALMTALVETGKARAKAHRLKFEEAYLLAKFAAALKEADATAEFYELAISLNRNANRPNVLIQMEMADTLLRLRKYKLAIDVYNEILTNRQLNATGQSRVYSSLAQALANDDRIDEALEAIGKAISLDDEKAGFRFFEAWIYSHAKRWDEAIRKFDQVMRDFPDDKEIILQSQFILSNIYVQKGEMRKGEEILEKVLEVNPDNAQVNNDLGYLWADQNKNLERAEQMIRKALAADPENGAYLDSLGWVLFKLEKYDEAVPPLQEATQKSLGGDVTVWDHLGDAFLKTMKPEKAVEAWQTALDHSQEESAPDAQLVERIKDKLKQHGATPRPKPAEKGSP